MDRMDNSGFIFTGVGLLLAIPALLLAACFSSMLDLGTETFSLQITGDKTFMLFENVESDMEDVMEISGRRAAISSVDYMTTYYQCLNSSTYSNEYGVGADGAIKELLLGGNITGIYHIHNPEIQKGSSINAWAARFANRAGGLGYNVSLQEIRAEDIYVSNTSDSSFNISVRIFVNITDKSNSSIYQGTIPRKGNLTVDIPAHDLGRSIYGCNMVE